MAQLDKNPCPGDWTISISDDGWIARQDALYAELQAASDAIDLEFAAHDGGTLVGALVAFPWADGHAIYRVSKDKPLLLQHVPYGDAWQVPYSQIRGMRRADIIDQLDRARRMKILFAKKGT